MDSNSNTNSDIDTESSSDDDFSGNNNNIKSIFKIDQTNKQDYVHEIFKHLDLNYSKIIGHPTNIVIYNISHDYVFPFIQFLLVKQDDKLLFNNIKLSLNYKKDICNLLLEDESNIRIKGYTSFDKEYYLFVNIAKNLKPSFIERNFKNWYCLVDEIINHNSVCNFSISPNVTKFLLSNVDYFLLKNPETMTIYETPIVVYTGSNFHQVELDGIFGPSKQSELSLFGPHYYFTTYEMAVEMGHSINKKYINAGINRYCLFCMKHKIINKPMVVYKMPPNYDSIYIGKMQINENIINKSPIWIALKSSQFASLSFHALHKNALSDECNKDYNKYFIS